MKYTWIVLVSLLVSYCRSAALHKSDLNNKSELAFAIVIFRHGDRTPIAPYPTDPYRNESEWPVPFGQLTPIGMEQEFALGKWLRSRYKNFLPEIYSPYDIYVRSSDFDRTLMSAQANLAGFYPLKNANESNGNNFMWTPIPIHTIPRKQDRILGGKSPCPRYTYEYNKLMKSPRFLKMQREYAELFKYISEHSGNYIDSINDYKLAGVFDSLYIENFHNKTLPPWAEKIFSSELLPLGGFMFSMQSFTKILARLKTGPLLGELVNHMVTKSRGLLSPDRKMWMYSGHDNTIANLLMALEMFDPHIPPYAAALLIELWKNPNNQYSVTISYKNSTDQSIILTLPACKPYCPLDEFVRLTKHLIPEDVEKECAMNFNNDNFDHRINVIIILVVLIMIMQIFLSLLLSFKICKQKFSVNVEENRTI